MINGKKSNTFSVTLFLILACVFIVYSNSFNGDWILDDLRHILQRPEIHLEKLTFQNIAKTFFNQKDGSEKLYRPVSCLTLGLNWFFGEDNPRGYHVVNLLIHLLTTVLLFKIIKRLLYLLNYKGDILLVSGIAAFLWAVHPIQTEAVSYIVQRMSSLAAMFYLAGIYFYLNFKTDRHKKWLAASLTMFLLAVFSKENAVLFPLAIIMIEFLLEDKGYWKKYILPGAMASIILILFFLFIFKGSILGFLEGYNIRPFTLKQRVLTEPRIIWFYIYQLFMAPPDSFGLNNPFVLSNSLFQPLTTFFSIAGIFVIVFLSAYWLTGRHKLLKLTGFSFLFFFVHHLVESTILPLELYYEHRNYLPSVFIFIPVALVIAYLVEKYRTHMIQWLVVIAVVAAMTATGLTTYNRNFVWQSPITFWKDAIKNDPESSRPYHNLAYAYDPIRPENPVKKDINKAITLYKIALTKNCRNKVISKHVKLYNLANIYFRIEHYDKAISYLNEDLRYLSSKGATVPAKNYRLLSASLLRNNQFKKALSVIQQGRSRFPATDSLSRIQGLILSLMGETEKGLKIYREQLLRSNKNHSLIWRDYGVALAYSGYKERGLWFLEKYYKHHCSDVKSLFFIANNLLTQNKPDQTAVYLKRLFDNASVSQVKKMIKKMYDRDNIYYLMRAKDRMEKAISRQLATDFS